jgi:hypothetical protein
MLVVGFWLCCDVVLSSMFGSGVVIPRNALVIFGVVTLFFPSQSFRSYWEYEFLPALLGCIYVFITSSCPDIFSIHATSVRPNSSPNTSHPAVRNNPIGRLGCGGLWHSIFVAHHGKTLMSW